MGCHMNNTFKHLHIYKITFQSIKKYDWFTGLAWNKKRPVEYVKFFIINYSHIPEYYNNKIIIKIDLKRENIESLLPCSYKIKTIEHLTIKDLPLYIDSNKTKLYTLLLKYQDSEQALLQLIKERKISLISDEYF